MRSGEKFSEEFSSSGDSSNFISNNQIFSGVSDATKKSIMNSIAKKCKEVQRSTKKCKERDNNIKTSMTNSADKSVDSKIHHHVPEN